LVEGRYFESLSSAFKLTAVCSSHGNPHPSPDFLSKFAFEMLSSGTNIGAVKGNAALHSVEMTVSTPTFFKLAHYFNREYSAVFEVLVKALRGHPEAVYYGRYQEEDYPLHWELVESGMA
jgi:hypothetical protein